MFYDWSLESSICPPYLPICGIFLPLQVFFSCATFKIFKILLFVSLFLSSWGSSRELDITCDKQGHFLPFTRCWWITSSTESTREQLKQHIKITHHSPPRNANLRNQLKHWTVVKPRRKRSVLAPLKTSCSHKSKSLACYGGLGSLSVVKLLTKTCIP